MTTASWLLGWGLRRGDARAIDVRDAMVLTALVYLLFAVVGAVAFAPVASPADSFFEAMPGFTTTGLTVMDVDELPGACCSSSRWIGGAGIIALPLVVLAGPGSAGAQLYAAEFG